MSPRAAASALAAWLLVGSITLTHAGGAGEVLPQPVETPFGRLASGTTVGLNMTNASGSVMGSLVGTTTNVWYLNNTNATSSYLARIDLTSSTGVSNLVNLVVGIDNGTKTAQVTGALGSLTQTGGSYVTLPPGSTNRIYVTQSVSLVGPDAVLELNVTIADDAAESATTIMRARLMVT